MKNAPKVCPLESIQFDLSCDPYARSQVFWDNFDGVSRASILLKQWCIRCATKLLSKTLEAGVDALIAL